VVRIKEPLAMINTTGVIIDDKMVSALGKVFIRNRFEDSS
jgi:hypothetical protein